MLRKRTGTALIANDIHQKLRDKILSLEIRPGERLLEDDICELLQAGRTPVREALLRLQGEGLVSRDRGWIVGQSDPGAFRTIFESRMAIEGFATRLAAERATPETLAELERLLAEMDRGEELPRSEVNRLNQSFHKAIVAMSGNPYFAEMHERTQFQYWNLRLPVIFMRDQLAHSAQQHHDIFDALKRQDGDAAEAIARDHIRSTMDIVADALRD